MEGTPLVPEEKMANDIREQLPMESGLTNKAVIDKYINDEKTKLNAIHWAMEFNKRFNGNWFTVKQAQKKTQFKKLSEALGVLQVLCLVGVAHGTNDNGEMKYKICVSPEQKVTLMKKELENLIIAKEQAMKELAFQYDMRISSHENEIGKMEAKVIEALPVSEVVE